MWEQMIIIDEYSFFFFSKKYFFEFELRYIYSSFLESSHFVFYLLEILENSQDLFIYWFILPHDVCSGVGAMSPCNSSEGSAETHLTTD